MSRSLPASTSLRRAGAAAALVIAAAVSASACGAGSDAATSQVRPDNATADLNGIHVANIQLVVDQNVPGKVAVTGSIVNGSKSADTLTGISISGASGAPVKLSGGSIATPKQQLVRIGGKGNPSAIATTDTVTEGDFEKVTFTFQNAGSVSLNAGTKYATGGLAGEGPTAAPTHAASTASPGATPTGSATATAGATSGATATAGATPSSTATR
ncbi:hypothetical protein BIV57_09390 [Mangrovactinospora gilvigrisea]|uniref:DUF461 domain-containing protein n=1 Tax=Mangrovactinospora gilvigrisea TaxID=1428644 RepID=A0A1J7BGT1_9ACTN|nr:hypothetical protein [Mangrovactinospora gilvigrisea]OIV37773.1 hypothetical protein BIV57_09390 [Mangrovactinospora gilvigrisea]